MILKRSQVSHTNYSLLDLIGTNETALAKIFAFILSSDIDCYFHFIRYLGVSINKTENNFNAARVCIEQNRKEGRTDIELEHPNKYRIIIECKVRKGKILKQREQYLTAFDDITTGKKILCFLTQERDTNKQITNDIIIKNISWIEIINLFNNKWFIKKELVDSFLKFAIKNYRMKEMKEILIQDVSNKIEIDRFKENNVYRRNQTFGTPIYFAPYFNRGCGEIEGITNLSKVLGILTLKPNDVEDYITDLKGFSDNEYLIKKWLGGIKKSNDDPNLFYTYYFLDEPLKFKRPLIKDRGKEKGRGKNWIAAMIPPNRCVSFTEFISHIPELIP